jgi:hypothetical protein
MRHALTIALALTLAACSANQATTTSIQPTADIPYVKPVTGPSRYMFENEITPGMKGYGLTVMHGGKIEPFAFTVLDVVQNLSPGNHAILVRCSGLNLEHSGIIAGMSGSPCFINGRMIGAIAYGWGMAKDPIAGVQPIRQMLDIQSTTDNASTTAAAWSPDTPLAKLAATKPGWNKLLKSFTHHANPTPTPLTSNDTQGLRPLASPLMVSGLSPASLKLLQQSLANTNLVPIASGSGGSTGKPGEGLGGIAELKPGAIQLEPGSSLAVPLVTGDIDMSAIGTVTEVAGNKVYAFGHAFLAQGGEKLPMSTGYIYTVMPNLNQSFKLGTSLGPAGTLIADEQTGIMGTLGAPPPQIPITITVNNGSTHQYHFNLTHHPKITAIVLQSLLQETLTARRQFPAQFTARITGEANFTDPAGGGGTSPRRIKLRNLGVTDNFDPSMTLLPVAVLVDNPFENLRLTSLSITADVEPRNQGGIIRAVTVDRLIAAPGDQIHIVADVERFQKITTRVPITLKIPADARDGDYELMVGSASMALMQEADYAPQRFDPTNIKGLEKAVERITDYAADHVYARLVMGVTGAALDGIEKHDLPASRVAMYASSRRTDTSPVYNVITTQADAGVVLDNGGQSFNLRIDRHADERYFSSKSNRDQGASGMGGPPRKSLFDRPSESRPSEPQE